MGLGESNPLNHCRDGVDCSEEEHLVNRRTEIKVVKMDGSDNVKVEYEDKLPEVIGGKGN